MVDQESAKGSQRQLEAQSGTHLLAVIRLHLDARDLRLKCAANNQLSEDAANFS